MSYKIHRAINHGDSIELQWGNALPQLFHAIWLRDHCQCSTCKSPDNGQRFLDVTQIPADIAVEDVKISPSGELEIRFSPDGHLSHYCPKQLLRYLKRTDAQDDERAEHQKRLWDKHSLSLDDSIVPWSQYCDDTHRQRATLERLRTFGFFVLTNTPARDGQVLEIIDSFGHTRTTNYGELFDVRATVDANNLAYTHVGLGAHTDNPYRNPVPGIQALHCVTNTVEGGESILLDGFKAASILREESPSHFATLTRTRVHFRFSDQHTDLRARVPMIETDERDRLISVRYNNRSIDTLALAQDEVLAFYEAYQHFAHILQSPALNVSFRLNAGDCIVLDNTRIMHARSGFSTSGERHLQGAYSDLDGLYSRLRQLKQETNA